MKMNVLYVYVNYGPNLSTYYLVLICSMLTASKAFNDMPYLAIKTNALVADHIMKRKL